MVVMVMPTACRARRADSRPEPGPETLTSSVFTPCSAAFRPASSAAIWAAYGVDLREPLKPMCPADDQEMAFPCASVMVTMVLLKLAFTCATPEVMFLRSRRLTRPGSLAIGQVFLLLLLAGDRLGRTLAGAGVGVRALAGHRQALAVAQAAVAGQVHQALDVHRGFAAQVAPDRVVAVDRLADLQDLGVGQLVHAAGGLDADLLGDFLRSGRADAVDVLKRDFDALVGRDVDASDTGHEALQIRVCGRNKRSGQQTRSVTRPSRKRALYRGFSFRQRETGPRRGL